MNNNKINLLPNSKNFDDNNETQKHPFGKLRAGYNTKTCKDDFLMHIPDEEEHNELDEVNVIKTIDQSADANNNKEESTEELIKEDIEPQENNQVKTTFFIKLKNIFFKK